jgi:hypothetical protein
MRAFLCRCRWRINGLDLPLHAVDESSSRDFFVANRRDPRTTAISGGVHNRIGKTRSIALIDINKTERLANNTDEALYAC